MSAMLVLTGPDADRLLSDPDLAALNFDCAVALVTAQARISCTR